MISWGEIYDIIEAMVPLYVDMALGYGSVKWWGIFTAAHSDTINCLICYFTLMVFGLEFKSQVNPYRMNYRFIGADVLTKAIVVVLLAFWVKFSTNGSLAVPLIRAMYGEIRVILVIQISKVLIAHRSRRGEEGNDIEANSNTSGQNSLLHLMRVVGMKVEFIINVY
ncbi:hypothetical protein GQ457_02G041670 [Hibiscus cannabinus]